MIFIWHSVFIRVVTLFVIVNIGTLFTIEYINPNIIPFYPSEWARVIDSYAGLAMFIVYLAILVIDAKNNYIEQFKQAQKSDKLKSAFLANMSHEIRTPLNAIMGFSNLLTKRELTKEKKEQYSMLITDNGKYLLNLISDILDISLIESNQLKINFTQVNLNDLFTNLSSTYNQMLTALNKKDVVLILNIPPETQIIETDEVRVEQVLANLLGNAIKFTNKGYIIFGYQPKDNMLHCFVEDTGRGIKEEFQSQVFDRFVKGEDNTDVFFERGAGIGLSLSKDLVHLLGGRLWFTSQYEVGSSFNFALPLNGKLLNL
jgi:signal transduction histidine kinase